MMNQGLTVDFDSGFTFCHLQVSSRGRKPTRSGEQPSPTSREWKANNGLRQGVSNSAHYHARRRFRSPTEIKLPFTADRDQLLDAWNIGGEASPTWQAS